MTKIIKKYPCRAQKTPDADIFLKKAIKKSKMSLKKGKKEIKKPIFCAISIKNRKISRKNSTFMHLKKRTLYDKIIRLDMR